MGPKAEVTSYHTSLSSVDSYNDYYDLRRARDASVRDLLRNARFTGALLSAVVKELQDVSLDDFCRYTGADVETGNSLGDSATEFGSTYTKDIRLDVVFEYNAREKLLLRINEEAQDAMKSYSRENKTSYSLVARAAYYAAMTLVTQLQSKEEYHEIRKVYSVWTCFSRPIPEMREPVVSYSIRPDADYRYKDGTPLIQGKRRFDNGDLLSIILISVADVNRIYQNKEQLYSGKYNPEAIEALYYLLSENTNSAQRKQYYYRKRIIVAGSEEGNRVSGIEELRSGVEELRSGVEELKSGMETLKLNIEEEKKKVEEEKKKVEEEKKKVEEEKKKVEKETKRADEAKQHADEAKQRADEAKQRADEAKQQAEEEKKRAEEEKKRAEELEIRVETESRRAAEEKYRTTVSNIKAFAVKFNWSMEMQLEMTAEQCQVSVDQAKEMYKRY